MLFVSFEEYLNVFLGADQHGLSILKEKKWSNLLYNNECPSLFFFVIIGVLQNREADEQVYF